MLTTTRLQRTFAKAGLGPLGKRLIRAARPAVAIERQRSNDKRLALGESKFNGAPDLPPKAKWPRWRGRPLKFLAQIDLTVATQAGGSELLPASGLLSFFYEGGEKAWGFDPKDRGSGVVVYTPPGMVLRRHNVPGALHENAETCALRFRSAVTFPDIWGVALTKAEEARHDDVFAAFERTVRKGQGSDEAPLHRMLGHPILIQNAMEEECQLVSNGVYLGGEELSAKDRARARRLKAGAKDWLLLAQFDSDDTASWMWGDLGVVYYWIRRQDLEDLDFSKVWCIMQCG